MRKADFYIIGVVLLMALIGVVIFYIDSNNVGDIYAEVYVFGELVHSVLLGAGHDDILIENTNERSNLIRITENGVFIAEASCRNQNCVQSGKHFRPGQIIACLPNRVMIRLVGFEDGGVDAVAY